MPAVTSPSPTALPRCRAVAASLNELWNCRSRLRRHGGHQPDCDYLCIGPVQCPQRWGGYYLYTINSGHLTSQTGRPSSATWSGGGRLLFCRALLHRPELVCVEPKLRTASIGQLRATWTPEHRQRGKLTCTHPVHVRVTTVAHRLLKVCLAERAIGEGGRTQRPAQHALCPAAPSGWAGRMARHRTF